MRSGGAKKAEFWPSAGGGNRKRGGRLWRRAPGKDPPLHDPAWARDEAVSDQGADGVRRGHSDLPAGWGRSACRSFGRSAVGRRWPNVRGDCPGATNLCIERLGNVDFALGQGTRLRQQRRRLDAHGRGARSGRGTTRAVGEKTGDVARDPWRTEAWDHYVVAFRLDDDPPCRPVFRRRRASCTVLARPLRGP
jgi:hypothetical protein